MSLTIEQIEQAIGISARKWKGRCYEISCAVVEAGLINGGDAVYGHYLGPIDPNSTFASNIEIGLARHGWIRTKEKIIDVTRWVFENRDPYVHVTDRSDCDYDEGGNALRKALVVPPPIFSETDKEIKPSGRVSFEDWKVLNEIVGGMGRLTNRQLAWIANLPPNELDDPKYIYGLLGKLGLQAFVPYDNWHMVME
jgi:hypothetical protein